MFKVYIQDKKTESRIFVGKRYERGHAVDLADCAVVDGVSAAFIFDQEGQLVYFSSFPARIHTVPPPGLRWLRPSFP